MTEAAALPISCYIRTLNEEANIVRCVTAARLVAADVVVVDSGSKDRTVALAEQAGARVFHQPWLGNGLQKRFAEEQCRHDWLLDLDADEVVTPALADEIGKLFARGEPAEKIHALRLVIVSPSGLRFERFAIAWRNKLYDRRVVRQPAHKAWDQFEVPAGVSVGTIHGPLDHYAYRDLGHLMEKQNRVSGVRARETRLPSAWSVGARVVFGLPIYFLKHYVTRGFFRGGIEGFSIAGILAIGRWLRDVKRYEQLSARRDTDTPIAAAEAKPSDRGSE
jgi:glycosyltransferase involved in cell wall biosynthesis